MDVRTASAKEVRLQDLPPGAFKTVVDAYYPSVVAAGSTARARAQNAYAVAAAIATALVAAGAFTGITDRSWWVKIFGFLAVMAWIATALIFMLAIGGRVRERYTIGEGPLTVEMLGATELTPANAALVEAVLANAKQESDAVSSTIGKGWICACVASVLTLTTFAMVGKLDDHSAGDHVAWIALSKQGQAALAAACPLRKNPDQLTMIIGRLNFDSLKGSFAKFTVAPNECRPASAGHDVTIELPVSQIAGLSRLTAAT
jgi:hypothetical protein